MASLSRLASMKGCDQPPTGLVVSFSYFSSLSKTNWTPTVLRESRVLLSVYRASSTGAKTTSFLSVVSAAVFSLLQGANIEGLFLKSQLLGNIWIYKKQKENLLKQSQSTRNMQWLVYKAGCEGLRVIFTGNVVMSSHLGRLNFRRVQVVSEKNEHYSSLNVTCLLQKSGLNSAYL